MWREEREEVREEGEIGTEEEEGERREWEEL